VATKKLLSIICPVYNERLNVPMFYQRLTAVMAGLAHRYDYELIFTNNCSVDETAQIIRDLRAQNPAVHLLTFSRNFGYQASVLGGFTFAKGDASIVIDVDCEDPPEMLAAFGPELAGRARGNYGSDRPSYQSDQ
jgi:polyisoprenyl-phosphate glycosyltransferase